MSPLFMGQSPFINIKYVHRMEVLQYIFRLAFYWIEAKETRINKRGIWESKCSKHKTRLLWFIGLKVATSFEKSFHVEVQKHFWFIAAGNIFPYDCFSCTNTKWPFIVKENKMTDLNCNANVLGCGGTNCKMTLF